MKVKIKDLTKEEMEQLCIKECNDDCPLAIAVNDRVICLINEMNKEITFYREKENDK